jgi:hypothetical protein
MSDDMFIFGLSDDQAAAECEGFISFEEYEAKVQADEG